MSTTPNTVIIGMTGLAGSGKDTFAKQLIDEFGFVKRSFAAPLKKLCCRLFGWEMALLDDLDYKQAPSLHPPLNLTAQDVRLIWLEQEVTPDSECDEAVAHLFSIFHAIQPDWTRRRILQWVGTEGFRALATDHWVKWAMRAAYESLADGAPGVVFTDCRFDNEARAIARAGGYIVQTMKIGQENADVHSSESGVSDHLIDFAVRAAPGDLECLRKAASHYGRMARRDA